MLYFRDYHWLRVNGASRFSAFISPGVRKREDVAWFLQLTYLASGPEWRRVQSWDRPRLWMDLHLFKVPGKSWRDLEKLNYWELPGPDDDYWKWQDNFGCGGLEAHFYPNQGQKEGEQLVIYDHMWRVAAREGRWLTVELASFVDGVVVKEEMPESPVAVTSTGETVREEPDVEFWKKHAQFYLLENVPFGTVTVRVPRNARDPESFALARARELVGIEEPDHIVIDDYFKRNKTHESLRDDLYVHLHLHGYYED